MANPILTKNSSEKVSSPEQLSDYIKVSNVGIWLILGMISILLISVFVWGVVGRLYTTVDAKGISENGTITCFLPYVDSIEVGDEVKIGDVSGEVESISQKPISSADAAKNYDEYTVYNLQLSDWNYEVKIKAKDCSDGLKDISIISDSVSPISFITG